MIELISLLASLIGLLLLIISIAVRFGSRISTLEKEIDLIKEDFKLHQALNETSFTKLENELRKISESLNKLLGYFEAKKETGWKS